MTSILKRVLNGIFATLAVVGTLESTLVHAQDENEIELTYVEWSSEVASANVIKVVLEELGYEVNLMPVTAVWMWQAVASGDVDGHVAAWLPTTHELYWEVMKDRVENLGPNLVGTKIGLVVPQYVTINSIEELNANAEMFKGKIIGIDPASGLMNKTKQVMDEYELGKFSLVKGSGTTMTAALGKAIKKNEWIVVTGWTPHWKFSRWELKYLEDTKGIYKPKDNRQEEHVATIVRKGLKEEMPEVYRVLNNFCWTPADMAEVMVWNSKQSADPYQNAERWVNENREKVDKWLLDEPIEDACIVKKEE
ncbi:MAG: glycine/betaine ABC transporter substrate-binding protein [Candidatus Parabeggiatoa sp. nov. 1]|nr:MAG: glycine/betaine ABC transporter substrate-binding protein [Gammaproteobacteria bacterium]HEC86186.1 glycine betaine ABC transporter substrate-binding protein [Thioploca sp.]